MTTRNYLLSLALGAALGFIINIGCAYAGIGDTYPEIGCTDRGDCYSMLCTVVTNTREHCVKVPTPRARPIIPCKTYADCMAKNGDVFGRLSRRFLDETRKDFRAVIPCDTDSDCMAKNGGNGDPIPVNCFDPQDDETFGENGILCRDGESY